jgi:hypothetical protein
MVAGGQVTDAAPCPNHLTSYGHAPQPPGKIVVPEMSVPSPDTTMKPEPRSSLLPGFPMPPGDVTLGSSAMSPCVLLRSPGKSHLQLAET